MNTNTQALLEALDEIEAVLRGAHAVMETVSGLERRVGPVGSHARGYTHKITMALERLGRVRALPHPPAPEQASGEQCPNCPNQGWFVVNNGGEPEQQQCEFCETVPNSIFNIRRAATTTAEPAVEAVAKGWKLDKPAQVGGGVFGEGVSWELVIKAAQRHYETQTEERSKTPEQRRQDEINRRAFWDLVNGPLSASPAAPEAAKPEALGESAELIERLSWWINNTDNPAENDMARAIALLAAGGGKVALWVSPGQFEKLTDPEGEFGRYLPVRKTAVGKFTLPLYLRHQPVVQAAQAADGGEGGEVVDRRRKVKLGSQYGGCLAGHWFYLQPADEFADAALARHTGIEARPQQAAQVAQPLTEKEIEAGRGDVFSINNPFCPCDSKTFRKAVQWAERKHGIGKDKA